MARGQSDGGRSDTGALTRRRLLQLAVGAGAVGAIHPLMRAGSRIQAWAAAPRLGGTLKMAWASSPRTLDPALAGGLEEHMILRGIYDNLTRIDEKLQAQPELATRWSSDQQARTWTFSLRQGVKFHHGQQFTAKDVVFTFERILDPTTGSPGRTGVGPIEKVEAVDAYTVRFRLSSPYADFPMILGIPYARIVPADRRDLIRTAPSGTGPFRLAEFRPGDRTRLTRFRDYWDRGRPYLDELWQVNIPQYAAQVASLAGGDVQVMFEVPAGFIPSLERNPNVSISEISSPGFQPVSMRTDQKPFNDNRVRLAMKHLVDRPGIIRAIWQGRATVANDHPVPSVSPFISATSTHTYDVARAKALLAEAGYPDGLTLELWTSSERVGMQELAVAVQQMAAPAGVKIEIKTLPFDVWLATVWTQKPFYCDNYTGRATIDETLFPYFHTRGAWNRGMFSHARIDRILEEGRSETDLRKRKEVYTQAQQLISAEGNMVIACHTNYVSAMRETVKGYFPHPLRWSDFRWTYLEA